MIEMNVENRGWHRQTKGTNRSGVSGVANVDESKQEVRTADVALLI